MESDDKFLTSGSGALGHEEKRRQETETHLHREFKAETHKHGEEEETKITRESIPNQISFSLAET